MTFTARQLLAAVEREIEMRKRVYPGRVYRGQMKQAEADRQLAMFEQIKNDYAKKAEAEEQAAAAEEAERRLL